jgi:cytochrome P450 family 110
MRGRCPQIVRCMSQVFVSRVPNAYTSSMTGSLPPGPGTLRAFRFIRAPFEFLDACARRYGEWFTVRFPGVPPFVFTSDPAATGEIFAGDPETLRAGEANAPLGAVMGPQSLLLLDGAAHLHERRLLLPPFHGERMHAYGGVMREITEQAIDSWPRGRPFPLLASMQAVTFEVILRTVFGFEEPAERERLQAPLRRLLAIFAAPLGSLLGLPLFQIDLGGWSPWGRVVRLKREIDAILFAEFARRRAQGVAGRDDVLSLLLEARDEPGQPMTDSALRDELLTLLVAGHETTAASLGWVFLRLMDRPRIVQRLREELKGWNGDARQIGQLTYLDAVIKEASRLDPVIPNIGRRLHAPLRLGGRELPAGVVVAPCIYLTHRRPDLWPDPERFDPERFLGARINPNIFFPFGGGVRRCLGAAFATYEMKVVLATVLSCVDLRLAPGYQARLVRRSIAFVPSEGLPVVAEMRPTMASAAHASV